MIISLFGPDGAGKTTLAGRPRNERAAYVFSGTDVASWPDKSWYQELCRQGIDDYTYVSDDHFREKIRRSHLLARELLALHPVVVIDSDPFHKTVMHGFMSGKDQFDELFDVAFGESSPKRTHVLLKVSDGGLHDQAVELQSRIQRRGAQDPFDPASVEESIQMIEACEEISQLLLTKGEDVREVGTEVDLSEFMEKIS